MARPSGGLGKGLSSLIPSQEAEEGTADATLREVPVSEITPNRHQPRRHFDEEALEELAASVKQLGVLQPILVRPSDDGGYELIAGERRWRAATRAGLTVIPAVIRTTDEQTSVEQALVENVQRQDLNPLEEAAAFQQLVDEFELSHEQVAERVGKSRSAITNTLRLLGLPPSVQQLLMHGRISAGHARALLGTPDRGLQEALAKQAADEGWSVRAVEAEVRAASGDAPAADPETPSPGHDGAGIAPSTRLRPPGLLELEELLAEHLATRVSVQMGARKGKIAIEFADLEDLERIYRRMSGS